jgi:hypothetical protein
VGEPADLVYFDDLRWAGTPGAAVSLIEEGHAALLPEDGNWQERVGDTLALLGASPEHIAWVLRMAQRVNERQDDLWPDFLPSDF